MRVWSLTALALVAAGCQPTSVDVLDLPEAPPARPDVQPAVHRPRLPMPMGDPDLCTPQDVMPGYSYPRLLTRIQYDNTLRDLFGVDIAHEVDFPPENETLGFANGTSHAASSLLTELFLKGAEAAAAQGLAPGTRYGDAACVAHGNAACAPGFIEEFTTRAFRRPLHTEETLIFQGVYDALTDELGHEAALAAVVEAVLQSPQFLYRIELGQPVNGADHRALSSYEMASRLSYLLWGTMPDDELFAAAARDELVHEDAIAAQARRMLGDGKADAALRDFHGQWLLLSEVHALDKDPSTYPEYYPALRDAWINSVLTFITEEGFAGGGNFETLFSSPAVYTDGDLAYLYDLPTSEGMARHELPAERAGGLLTQPGLLAALSNANQASPILRGVFVREHILCEVLPDPPANVPIIPPDPDPDATTRERFAAHTEQESCRSCHELIDPVGFGFEAYDGLGRYRTTENGLPIDDSGALLYTWSMDPDLEGDFHGAIELAQRIGQSDQARNCYATQWFRYALGRAETAQDTCNLGVVHQKFAEHGDLNRLILDLVRMPAFRTRDLGEVAP